MEDTSDGIIESLRAAYEAHPHDVEAAARLAEYFADRGWYNEALEIYREALKKHGDEYFLHLGYGNACYRHGDLNEALAAFRKLTELRPERIEGWNNSGIVLMAAGDAREAQRAFARVLEIEPDNAGALLNMGNCFMIESDHFKARELFDRAIAARPDYADAWFNLGNAHIREQEYRKAKLAFDRALRYQREFTSALKNRGLACERLGEWDEAADCYRKAADRDKTDAGIQINLANVYLGQDKLEEAKSCFLKAVKLAPKNVAGWLGLRHIALMKGDIPTYVRATMAIVPHLSDAAVAKCAEILLEINQTAQAGEIIASVDACSKEGDELDAQRLIVYQRSGHSAARQAAIYKKLSSLASKSDAILKALARYSLDRDEYAEAVKWCSTMQQIDAAARSIMTRALMAGGEREKARAIAERSIAEYPDCADFPFALARLEIEAGRRAEAQKYLLQALELGFAAREEIDAHPELSSLFKSLAPEGAEASHA